MKILFLTFTLILFAWNCHSQPSKIYFKDKSQYDPTFVEGLKAELGHETINVIDDSLFCTSRPNNKSNTLVTYKYSIPTNLELNKQISFSTIRENIPFTLLLRRTNYTNIEYQLRQEEKTIKSGVTILQSTFYFGKEGQDDENGKPIYLEQYIDSNKCGAIIKVEIKQAKLATITWCIDEKSGKWMNLPIFRRE